MIRNFFIAIFMVFSITTFAQTATHKIILVSGKKIMINQTNDMEMTISMMGQGIDMKSNSNTETLLEVMEVAENKNRINSTLKKIKLSSEMMGGIQTYDSENEADKNSELGKQFTGKLNVPKQFMVNNLGQEVEEKEAEEDASLNPMEGFLGMSADGRSIISNSFLILPQNAKIDDSWTDSIMTDKIKTIKKYTIKNIADYVATIDISGTVTGEKKVEVQGTEMSVNINTTFSGKMMSNISTGLVEKSDIVTEMNNTMELMGSPSTMTGKVTSTATYIAQ